jgi:hypothetical protein
MYHYVKKKVLPGKVEAVPVLCWTQVIGLLWFNTSYDELSVRGQMTVSSSTKELRISCFSRLKRLELNISLS